MTRILVVDDVVAMAEQYAYDLQRLGGWRVRIATSGPDALEALRDEELDCVILDLEMRGMDGLEVLRRMQELGRETPVIVQRLREGIRRLAPIPSPVLILGESGSGKELVARGPARARTGPEAAVRRAQLRRAAGDARGERAVRSRARRVHGRGPTAQGRVRARRPRHAVPGRDRGPAARRAGQAAARAGEPRGHARGRRSRGERRGARGRRHAPGPGARGGGRDVPQDLLYRLNVHVLRVPPLAERLSDVPELVEHFVAQLCARFGMRRKRVSPEALAAPRRYDWRKNNVGELRNAVERMLIAAEGDVIGGDGVPAEILEAAAARPGGAAPGADGPRTYQERKLEAERAIVPEALHAHDGDITRTAEALGLADHASLLKIVRRLGIRRAGEG